MSARFGRDFADVRVHTDSRAADSADAVDARAYTVGRHIVFGPGEYQPEQGEGRRLLEHELVHVVQHADGARIAAAGSLRVSEPGEAAERAAERHSPTERPSAGPSVGLARQPKTPAEPSGPGAEPSEEELAQAGSVALAVLLRRLAEGTAVYREMYDRGAAQIEAAIASMRTSGMNQAEIARRASAMRHQLAVQVREASGRLMRAAAEAYDAARGNVGRPTYESLRGLGKTDAQIIASAARTNRFVSRLPTGLRWGGRGLWFVSGGISIYLVTTAPPEQQLAVAQQEVSGIAGAAVGTMVAEAVCIGFGIATEGIGLLVCGLIGGIGGFEAGRRAGPGAFEELGRQQIRCVQACEELPWYLRGFCLLGCSHPGP